MAVNTKIENSRTKYNEQAAQAWNHEGFASRMNGRLEKVRQMNKTNDNAVNVSGGKNKIHVM